MHSKEFVTKTWQYISSKFGAYDDLVKNDVQVCKLMKYWRQVTTST